MTPTKLASAVLFAAALLSQGVQDSHVDSSQGKTIGKTVGAALDYLPDSTRTSTHVDCEPFVLAEDVDYSHLTDAGWFGIGADGMEALYAPECGTTAEDGSMVLTTFYRD